MNPHPTKDDHDRPGHLCSVCRTHLVPVIGTTRRLQALARAGYDSRFIAQELAVRRQYVRHWRAARRRHVWRVTHLLVHELYGQLWDTDGPNKQVQRWAITHGWEPYEAWTEDTIDDPSALPWAALDQDDYIDPILLDRVRRGQAGFTTLNLAEQATLLQGHLAAGGALRAFRDRYRPVPIDNLRAIAARFGLELDL